MSCATGAPGNQMGNGQPSNRALAVPSASNTSGPHSKALRRSPLMRAYIGKWLIRVTRAITGDGDPMARAATATAVAMA